MTPPCGCKGDCRCQVTADNAIATLWLVATESGRLLAVYRDLERAEQSARMLSRVSGEAVRLYACQHYDTVGHGDDVVAYADKIL